MLFPRGSYAHYHDPQTVSESTVSAMFRSLVSSHEYDALGEEFEDKEHALFGDDVFVQTVAEVAKLEQVLGISTRTRRDPVSHRWEQNTLRVSDCRVRGRSSSTPPSCMRPFSKTRAEQHKVVASIGSCVTSTRVRCRSARPSLGTQ